MSFDYCADLVQRGDPDRFLSAMTAQPDLRGRLMALYAFNLEVARVPWVTQEPNIAEMRLQFWIDSVEGIFAGRSARKHEVLEPLAQVIAEADLSHEDFEALMNARQFDIYKEPHADVAAFERYIDATSGALMRLAARALGAPEAAMAAISDFAFGAGVGNLLRAAPALMAYGRHPFPAEWQQNGDALAAIRAAGAMGQARIARARAARATVPADCKAALLAGWRADQTLVAAIHTPQEILDGSFAESEFRKKASLLWRNMTGRW